MKRYVLGPFKRSIINTWSYQGSKNSYKFGNNTVTNHTLSRRITSFIFNVKMQFLLILALMDFMKIL